MTEAALLETCLIRTKGRSLIAGLCLRWKMTMKSCYQFFFGFSFNCQIDRSNRVLSLFFFNRFYVKWNGWSTLTNKITIWYRATKLCMKTWCSPFGISVHNENCGGTCRLAYRRKQFILNWNRKKDKAIKIPLQ